MVAQGCGWLAEFATKPETSMDCSDKNQPKITRDELIAKLKDDGDFDRLRLNIIRKLKDDEELRENLKCIVRQSSAINRLGAENMKPRQLSDAIYQEVGDQLTGRISDGLWGIIRSSDGVNSEIVETVHSVYNRLMSAKGISNAAPVQKEEGDKGSGLDRAAESDYMLSDASEPKEPPGFLLRLNTNKVADSQLSFRQEKRPVDEQQECSVMLHDKQKPNGVFTENKQPGDCSDEDPDVPPGFG